MIAFCFYGLILICVCVVGNEVGSNQLAKVIPANKSVKGSVKSLLEKMRVMRFKKFALLEHFLDFWN